jgi:hypothetical protein
VSIRTILTAALFLSSPALAAEDDVCFGEVPTVDLVPRDMTRMVTPLAGGGHQLSVSFTAGSDASDRTISDYKFVLTFPSGAEAVLKRTHSDVCLGARCVADLWVAPSAAAAELVPLMGGFFSPAMIRFVEDAGTVRADGEVCEAEKSSDCPCTPCSTGPDLAKSEVAGPEQWGAIMEVQNLEHLHGGWVDAIP